MGDKVKPETGSPYKEVLQLPRSGSPSRTPRETSAKTPRSTSASHKTKKHRNTRKQDENEREIRLVSKEVKRKLELYINHEKRQTRFKPEGSLTTTRRMAEFDMAYTLLEHDKIERESPRNPKSRQNNNNQHNKHKDPYTINPQLVESSRRVTNYSEVDRLSKYASEVFTKYPVEQLAVIHRYKPHPLEHKKKSTENGDILGYSGHVGAALNQKAYVDFYIKEGLNRSPSQNSNRSKSSIKKSKPNENTDSKSNENRKNTSPGKNSNNKTQSSQMRQNDTSKVKTPHQCDNNCKNTNNSSEDKSLKTKMSSDDTNGKTHENMNQDSSDKNREPNQHKGHKDSQEEEHNNIDDTKADSTVIIEDKTCPDDKEEHNSPGKHQVDKSVDEGEGDNKSMRSYVSVEHVREVNVTDI